PTPRIHLQQTSETNSTHSLHDALPISRARPGLAEVADADAGEAEAAALELDGGEESAGRVGDHPRLGGRLGEGALAGLGAAAVRSEEHTSEPQSPGKVECRLLLEKRSE